MCSQKVKCFTGNQRRNRGAIKGAIKGAIRGAIRGAIKGEMPTCSESVSTALSPTQSQSVSLTHLLRVSPEHRVAQPLRVQERRVLEREELAPALQPSATP